MFVLLVPSPLSEILSERTENWGCGNRATGDIKRGSENLMEETSSIQRIPTFNIFGLNSFDFDFILSEPSKLFLQTLPPPPV